MTGGGSPADVARTVSWALQGHAEALARAERAVPDWLPELAAMFAAWATGGTGKAVEVTVAPPPRVLHYDQVADLLGGISVATVRRLVKAGDLRAVKVGGTPMVRIEDFDAYLDGLPGLADVDNPVQSATTGRQSGRGGHGCGDEHHDTRRQDVA